MLTTQWPSQPTFPAHYLSVEGPLNPITVVRGKTLSSVHFIGEDTKAGLAEAV